MNGFCKRGRWGFMGGHAKKIYMNIRQMTRQLKVLFTNGAATSDGIHPQPGLFIESE
jgi:hypothetical protein